MVEEGGKVDGPEGVRETEEDERGQVVRGGDGVKVGKEGLVLRCEKVGCR